jgi:hypothetical protein
MHDGWATGEYGAIKRRRESDRSGGAPFVVVMQTADMRN